MYKRQVDALPAGYSLSSATTDDVSEGSSNLYHTTDRARASISAGGDLAYNSSTGVMSVTLPTVPSTLNDLSDVDATTGAANGKILKYNGSSWEMADDLSAAGGIALTDLSVVQASAGTAALSYNNGTGVFTYTPPDLSNANTAYSWGDHDAVGYLTSSSSLNGANVNAMRDFTHEHIATGTFTQSGTTRVFADGAVTYAKIQNVSAADKILGRVTVSYTHLTLPTKRIV